jgi:uncharacterized protein YaiL (DUF2058 family)
VETYLYSRNSSNDNSKLSEFMIKNNRIPEEKAEEIDKEREEEQQQKQKQQKQIEDKQQVSQFITQSNDDDFLFQMDKGNIYY